MTGIYNTVIVMWICAWTRLVFKRSDRFDDIANLYHFLKITNKGKLDLGHSSTTVFHSSSSGGELFLSRSPNVSYFPSFALILEFLINFAQYLLFLLNLAFFLANGIVRLPKSQAHAWMQAITGSICLGTKCHLLI